MKDKADDFGSAKGEEEASMTEVKVEERSEHGRSPLDVYARNNSQEHQVDELEDDEIDENGEVDELEDDQNEIDELEHDQNESDELEDDQKESGAGKEGRKNKRRSKIARRKVAADKARKLEKRARQGGGEWNRRQFWSCLGMEPLDNIDIDNIDIGPILHLNTKTLQPIQAYIKSHPAYSATIKPFMSKLGNDPTLFERVHIDLVYALCMSEHTVSTSDDHQSIIDEHTVSITDEHQSIIDELSILLNDL